MNKSPAVRFSRLAAGLSAALQTPRHSTGLDRRYFFAQNSGTPVLHPLPWCPITQRFHQVRLYGSRIELAEIITGYRFDLG